jgi:hypothetical protein
MILRELFAKLGLDFEQTEFDKADVAVNKLKRAAQQLAAVFAAGAVARGLQRITFGASEAADHIQKTADKLGVGTAALQEYQHAARLSGIEVRAMEMGLQRFTRRAAEAAKGKGEAKDALRQMGIQLRGSDGRLRASEDMLMAVADAMAAVSDDGERVRLAFKLFDSEGVSMVNMLRRGSGALAEMRGEAHELGGVFDEEFIEASVEVQDNLTRLSAVANGLRVMIASRLLPWVNETITSMIGWWKGIRQVLEGTKILEVVLWALAAAAGVLVFVLSMKLLGALGGVAVMALKVAGGFSAAGASALLMQLKLVGLGALMLLLAGLIALLAEEIVGNFTGMETAGRQVVDAMGELYDWFMSLEAANPVLNTILKVFKAIAEAVRTTVNLGQSGLMWLLSGGEDTSGFKTVAEDLMARRRGQSFPLAEAGGVITDVIAGLRAGLPLSEVARTAFSSSNSTDVKVEVDARGASDPDAVGAAVATATVRQIDERLKEHYQLAIEHTTPRLVVRK